MKNSSHCDVIVNILVKEPQMWSPDILILFLEIQVEESSHTESQRVLMEAHCHLYLQINNWFCYAQNILGFIIKVLKIIKKINDKMSKSLMTFLLILRITESWWVIHQQLLLQSFIPFHGEAEFHLGFRWTKTSF